MKSASKIQFSVFAFSAFAVAALFAYFAFALERGLESDGEEVCDCG